jgi:LacI family transcriptional regulator
MQKRIAEFDGPDGRPERLTIREIAALAGVSIATVSRVLNGRPDVSPATRDAVIQYVRATNYQSNRSARALSSGKTGLIGLTAPFLQGEYFSLIVAGASEALYEQDMRLVVCPTQHEHDREVTLLDRLMHGTTDGALLLLPTESTEELSTLQKTDFPFVVIDPRYVVGEGVPSVGAAHSAGAKAGVDHLISLGHTRIAAITGPVDWCATQYRIDGYHASMASAGILARPEWIVESDYLISGGYHAARQLLRLPELPTAIFAFNDNMAVGTMRAIREAGLRIPDDISLIGFDDLEIAAIVTPPLTTVRQPLEEMGRMAANLLTRLIDGQRVEALRVDLETRLVMRESTGPARA